MRTAIMSFATCSPLRTSASKRCATMGAIFGSARNEGGYATVNSATSTFPLVSGLNRTATNEDGQVQDRGEKDRARKGNTIWAVLSLAAAAL
jgi:hypothetical protein